MVHIIHWLLGWVTVELEGPFPERWFNICAATGLKFWNVQWLDAHRIRMTLSRWDLKQARTLSQQALCAIEETGESGLPAFLLRFRGRYGMAAGAVLFVLLLTVLSHFIMVIEVEGNSAVPDAAIVAGLQRCGFGVGTFGPSVDVRALSNEALLEMEELSFLTVEIHGIRARVEVRETAPVPELADNTTPADVIAARDGWIVDLDVISGQCDYAEGDAVLAGDTVISHLLTNLRRDGSGEIVSTQSVRARGEVWAMTKHTLSASTPLAVLIPPKNEAPKTGYALEFLGRRLNFYGNCSNRDRECVKIAILYALTLPDGSPLPFGFWQVDWQALQPAWVNSEQAEQYLKDTLTRRLESALEDGKILNSRWKVKGSDGAVTVTLEARCLEQIGVTMEIPKI